MSHVLLTTHQFIYLDPGSGSFIIQMVIAGALGAGLAITIFWGKIKSVFIKKSSQPDDTDSDVDDGNEPD